MARYTLTKSYSEIEETYGVFQNSSGNADIEITNSLNEAGIVLRPFQTVTIKQKVFARKIGNAGACLLTVLPFRELWEHPYAVPPKRCDDEESRDVTFDEYGNLFLHDKHRAPPLSVQETPHHYLVSVSKESLKGQNKFLIQFDDRKGRS